MTQFETYLRLGFAHIADPTAYDHILFVVALCAVYRASEWRRILILITAFTVGHSITLALATFHVIEYDTQLIEWLIPITIILTCILNFSHKSQEILSRKEQFSLFRYPMALCFGLIHGLGFSNFLRSMLGRESEIWQPLLAFNLGLEVGQLLIVLATLLLSFILLEVFRVRKHDWNLILSATILGMTLTLLAKAEFWQRILGMF